MIVRVQVIPARPPRYVSVVLDARKKGRGRIETLHSFGKFSFESLARAEQFRLNCELAMRLYRTAVTRQDQESIVAVFGNVLGVSTLVRLLQVSGPGLGDLADWVAPISQAALSVRRRPTKR